MVNVEYLFAQFIKTVKNHPIKFPFHNGVVTVRIIGKIIRVQDTYNDVDAYYSRTDYGDLFDDIFLYYAECKEYKNNKFDYMVCEESYNKIVKLIKEMKYENS